MADKYHGKSESSRRLELDNGVPMTEEPQYNPGDKESDWGLLWITEEIINEALDEAGL